MAFSVGRPRYTKERDATTTYAMAAMADSYGALLSAPRLARLSSAVRRPKTAKRRLLRPFSAALCWMRALLRDSDTVA